MYATAGQLSFFELSQRQSLSEPSEETGDCGQTGELGSSREGSDGFPPERAELDSHDRRRNLIVARRLAVMRAAVDRLRSELDALAELETDHA